MLPSLCLACLVRALIFQKTVGILHREITEVKRISALNFLTINKNLGFRLFSIFDSMNCRTLLGNLLLSALFFTKAFAQAPVPAAKQSKSILITGLTIHVG